MASRVLGALAVVATAALASLALATPASAHTPEVKAWCDEKAGKSYLTVDLRDYVKKEGKKNSLTVTIDGKDEPAIEFDKELLNQKWNRPGDVKHTYKVSIKAWDDPNGKNGWTKTYDKSTEACVKTPPKPSEPTKPQEPKPSTPSEAPSSSVTPPPSTTTPPAPAPGGSTPEPPLAATGASPLWLLLSGLGLVGAGAGTLLFLRRRRSA